jgi:hypothetical protein
MEHAIVAAFPGEPMNRRSTFASAVVVTVISACSGSTVPLGGPLSAEDAGAFEAAAVDAAADPKPLEDAAITPAPRPDAGVFSFDATLAVSPPPGSKVVVVWLVVTKPEYPYLFGQGLPETRSAFVTFSSAPPAEALIRGTLGIALVALVDGSVSLPEGKYTWKEIENVYTFQSTDHSVIYRANDDALGLPWPSKFQLGYSCGRCIRRGTIGARFDEFEPVDCNEVTLRPYVRNTACDWN